jgi:poly [ADP-ribose] polymerase
MIFSYIIEKVLGDYDAMLNQTNIGANNNKFYVIQVLTQGGSFHTWTRWGRVVSKTKIVFISCKKEF